MRKRQSGGIVAILASGEQRSSLIAFAASLPDWLPVPLVLCITDADSNDESLLDRLRHGCPLPIHEVQEPTALEAGNIYVDMSGGGLCIRAGRVFAPHVHGSPSMALLSSAITEHGGQTIAILLGGTQADAAAAAHKVVWAGGAVFAHQVEGEQTPLIRNGVARAYKSAENLAEALGVVCLGLQRAVS